MKTDKELLELAAKAAGVVHPEVLAKHLEAGWNPLEDEGDALRLAVKLELSIDFAKWANTVFYGVDKFVQEEWHNSCSYEATRRAIVRAAAEMGEKL